MGIASRLWAVLRLRCPRCCEGKVFRSTFQMNDPCPVCGLVFQREEGYFLGSMYVSYLLSSIILVVSFVAGHLLLADWNPHLVLILVFLPFIPLVPVVFRYSRVIWMHFERWVCPSDISAGPYEKMRQTQDQAKTRGGLS
jgi:uncharacterized protein (DUF983 family)